MNASTSHYIHRELSWLSFNDRVLQEAADHRTPLIERIKFLGIFSSNLDEFFRVRVATLKRMVKAGKKIKELYGEDPKNILNRIQRIVLNQQNTFDVIYEEIQNELRQQRIYIIDEQQLTGDQEAFVRNYFRQEVRPALFPIMIDALEEFPNLRDHFIYLAVRMTKGNESETVRHALMEIPTNRLSRFLVLPKKINNTYIILLDDVIRVGLREIFAMFDFSEFYSFTIKLTRDAELDIDPDITRSFFEKISKSLKQRKSGAPVRFVYDANIPGDFLRFLIRKNHISSTDTLVPGGRYHNFKDFMDFPPVGSSGLRYGPMPPLPHRDLKPAKKSLFETFRKRDILLHYPYQSFHYFIDVLREASIDPQVSSIKITVYRVAKNSNVINALINAARNGKSVTVILELQARFDEEANIYWTTRLRDEGVEIIHGVPDLKVHCKLCMITRSEQGEQVNYVTVGTGNFNESTARLYCDHSLFTTDERIAYEVERMFEFFRYNYKTYTYRHLLVSPFYQRDRLVAMIKKEITNAEAGKEAHIILKVNNLEDRAMIEWLYRASGAGVRIDCLVRGICSLVPGVKGVSENITAVSIVDRFLEHSRVFVFCNGGEPRYYISSADWMTRNLDHRIEVGCPVYDPAIQQQLQDMLDIQLRDNTKARYLNGSHDNQYKLEPGKTPVRAQAALYDYLKGQLGDDEGTGGK